MGCQDGGGANGYLAPGCPAYVRPTRTHTRPPRQSPPLPSLGADVYAPSTGRMRSNLPPNPPAHPVGAHLFRLGSAPQLGCGDQQNTCYTHPILRNDSRAPH